MDDQGIIQAIAGDSSKDEINMDTEEIMDKLSDVQAQLAENQQKRNKGTTKKKGDDHANTRSSIKGNKMGKNKTREFLQYRHLQVRIGAESSIQIHQLTNYISLQPLLI